MKLFMFLVIATLLLLLLLQVLVVHSFVSNINPETSPANIDEESELGLSIDKKHVPKRINCGYACSRRCRESSRKNVCHRACKTCCTRCGCVPPGTYGNTRACPCYANLKTHGNKPKCP